MRTPEQCAPRSTFCRNAARVERRHPLFLSAPRPGTPEFLRCGRCRSLIISCRNSKNSGSAGLRNSARAIPPADRAGRALPFRLLLAPPNPGSGLCSTGMPTTGSRRNASACVCLRLTKWPIKGFGTLRDALFLQNGFLFRRLGVGRHASCGNRDC
jgi:hypothetical protein